MSNTAIDDAINRLCELLIERTKLALVKWEDITMTIADFDRRRCTGAYRTAITGVVITAQKSSERGVEVFIRDKKIGNVELGKQLYAAIEENQERHELRKVEYLIDYLGKQ